jgi:hypothetical protein
MGATQFTLALAGLAALCLVALAAFESRAAMWPPAPTGALEQQETLATPVAVWRDCQEISFCNGCKPRYKCRSCTYKRTCAGGICSWGDVCVWGPVVKVLPRGARIIRIK